MKRSQFFMALLAAVGIGKAQQSTLDPNWRFDVCLGLPKDIKLCDPVENGRCPVCGTMAEPYVRPRNHWMKNCKPVPGGRIFWWTCDNVDDPYGPTAQLVRCKKCSVAFWQDEQGGK